MNPADPKARPRRLEPIAIEVVLVGEDLLAGETRDDQVRRVAAFGRRHGGVVRRATIVPHDADDVRGALEEAVARRPDLLVVTGGLGPGLRDCTLACVAEVYGRPLQPAPLARRWIEEAYTRLAHRGVVASAGMNADRERLGRIPVGARPLKNDHGVAVGIWLRLANRPALLCLPGMPREGEGMLAEVDEAMRELRPRPHVVRREIESPTADEAALRPLIARLVDEFPGVRVRTRPTASARRGSNVRVVLETSSSSDTEANGRIGEAIRRLIALQSGS